MIILYKASDYPNPHKIYYSYDIILFSMSTCSVPPTAKEIECEQSLERWLRKSFAVFALLLFDEDECVIVEYTRL